MTQNGAVPVPTQGGAASLEILSRISFLEHRIEKVEKHATENTYGVVRLSGATDITDSTGIALDSTQNNASVDGTLANRIVHNQNKIGSLELKTNLIEFEKFLGENYVMNYNDFPTPGFYHIASLSGYPDGNAPSTNVGDYHCVAFYPNPYFQTMLMISPRETTKVYFGSFWNKVFGKWKTLTLE